MHLELGQILCERGDRIQHAWFPIDSFVSLVAQVDDHPGLEVGMVGWEGMLGVHLALGASVAPVRALVQGAGTVRQVGARTLRAQLAESAALRRVLARYTDMVMTQLATSAACTRFHMIVPRLARWLLISQDRARSDRFQVTHEFLALMLGVRRVGITGAASILRDKGLIDYHRGALTVLDRAGLEAVACSCYASGREADARSFPPRRTVSQPVGPALA